MNYYDVDVEKVIEDLQTDAQSGLSSQEVSKRQAEYGANVLKGKKKKGPFLKFIDQFKDVMILILLVAAGISFGIACTEGELKAFFEPLLILAIVVVNAIMGVVQENKAEKALEALKNMSAPHSRVIRGGKEQIIMASALVPGDIIKLEAGDFVPADARLIYSASLKSEESALTGESVPSEKDAKVVIQDGAPIGDRVNMVYSGCSITYGTAVAVVTAIGMDTEMGRIAALLSGEEEGATPLQKKLATLGKYLGVLALAICLVIFVIGVINNTDPLEIFMIAVSLAVSAIPEGLPAIVTIVLSIGVQRLAKKNAVIRRLPAVETLGGASIICSDKTGTLTQNRMTLVKGWVEGEAESEEITRENSEKMKKLLAYATLCSDGSVLVDADKVTHIGDPTETAIVLAAYNNGMSKEELNVQYPRLATIPFDSDRKLMSTVNTVDGKTVVIVKGAFDVMAARCVSGDIKAATEFTESLSAEALRVLAVGYKIIDGLPQEISPETLENGLTFMGLLGMIDPPRPEAKAAVETCLRAGIRPIMITGDHVITASAIARQLGILQDGQRAITGVELDAMSEQELDGCVNEISVYARVSPENKIRIVKAWQKKGHVVSMTGDGVNDAPALKAADIGCAMGITGTDVAKGASDMTLSDDNFATIVDAVKEGRGIYTNIKKVVGFLLGTNFGEIVSVFAAMLIWSKSPFMSMQLLWINLITDGLPAIALGMEKAEKDIMDVPPRPKNEGMFAHGYGVRVILQGVMFGALALIAYAIGLAESEIAGQTMAFIVLAFSQIVQAYNMRSDRSLFAIGPFSNKKLNQAAMVAVLLMVVVLFTPLNVAFHLTILPWHMYLIALALITVPLVVMEIAKALGLFKNHK